MSARQGRAKTTDDRGWVIAVWDCIEDVWTDVCTVRTPREAQTAKDVMSDVARARYIFKIRREGE